MLRNYLAQNRLLFVCLIAPFAIFPTFSPPLTAIAWGGVVILWINRWLVTGHFISRTPVDVTIFFLIILLPINVWASFDLIASGLALSRLLWGVVLFYGLLEGIRDQKTLSKLIWLILAGGALIAIVGLVATDWQENKIVFLAPIYRYLPQVSAMPGVLAGRSESVRGLFHPNIIAVTLSMIIPLVIGFMPTVKSKWQWGIVLILLLGMSSVLLLTQSRLAIAALMLALWGMAVSKQPKLWFLAPMGFVVVGTVVLYIGWDVFWNGVTDLFFVTGTGSWRSRQEVWQNAFRALGDFPFTGIGLAVFEPVSRLLYPYQAASTGWQFRHAHNNFLQAGLDFGLIGLVVYTALLLGLVWLGWDAYRHAQEPFRHIVRGAMGSFGVYWLFGMFDALPFWVKPGFLPWLVFGLIAVCWKQVCREEQNMSQIASKSILLRDRLAVGGGDND